MSHKAPEIHSKSANESRLISIDCSGKLDSGELMTGSVTVPAVSGITITNEAVNTSTLTINGVSVIAGKAIQMLVSSGTAGNTYTIAATVATDSTPAQTLEIKLDLEVH